MEFVLGILLGGVLLYIVKSLYLIYNTYITLNTPLDTFINSDISSFTFIERKNHYIKIQYDNDCYLVILINTKSVNVFIKDELTIYLVDENKSKMEHLYNKLINGFYHEIFTNIIELNGNIFSNNLFNVDQSELGLGEHTQRNTPTSFIPSVNDILDKISESGVSSLTQSEINILKEHS